MPESGAHAAAAGPSAGPGLLNTVLFDLDGTLADTAPDLAYALNRVLQQEGRVPLPFELIRPVVSHGGAALISLGFGIGPEHGEYSRLRAELLRIYEENLSRDTRLFPGIPALLDALETRGLRWGVVTNKPAWLTDPLLQQLGLTARASCVISGDTTANRKPHPEPMLLACQHAGCNAGDALYVGDALRDIEAGRSAGMSTAVALYGYLDAQDTPQYWGADLLVTQPHELLPWIDMRRKAVPPGQD